jgi:hypothetical protein
MTAPSSPHGAHRPVASGRGARHRRRTSYPDLRINFKGQPRTGQPIEPPAAPPATVDRALAELAAADLRLWRMSDHVALGPPPRRRTVRVLGTVRGGGQ